LNGRFEDENADIVIIDHPQNPGYPMHWHARDYGLFAGNALGQKVFSNGKLELNYKLAEGESTHFNYRIVISNGPTLSNQQIEDQFIGFSK
jgi:hypothetical protein